MTTILIGEAPSGRAGAPDDPLAGYDGKIGSVRHHVRINLLPFYPGRKGKGSAFPAGAAQLAAAAVMRMINPGDQLVLMGTRVAAAFGLKRSSYEFLEWTEVGGHRAVVCPHPSGVNRWWNSPANRERVLEFFAREIK